MEFISLSQDVILCIVYHVRIYDICNLRLVCRRLNNLLDTEVLWKKFCIQDYPSESNRIWYAWTYKEFYTKVLHRFRYLLGWWKRDLVHYGGLLKVQVEPDGIFGYECLPPVDDSYKTILRNNVVVLAAPNLHRFRYRRIFCLKPVGKQILCLCYQSMLGHLDRIGHSPCPDASTDGHCCSELCHTDKMFVCKTEDGFKFVCHQPDKHDYNVEVSERTRVTFCAKIHCLFILTYWFETEHGFRPAQSNLTRNILMSLYYGLHYYVRMKKFDTLSKLCCFYDLSPFSMRCYNEKKPLSTPSTNVSITVIPGVFFGTYSAHGWEIIDVRLSENGELLEGIKLTGDPNVPAGQISFRVHLKKPLYFAKNDQLSLDDVRTALERNESNNYREIDESATKERQTYVTPAECVERGADLPRFCASRFLAEGQIAGEHFANPTLTPCVFVGFDEHFFALLWLELQSISTFYRVNDVETMDVVR